MKISKTVPFVLATIGLFALLPANASGNAHKYPVFVPKEAEIAKPVEAVTAKPSEPIVTKPTDAPVAKTNALTGIGIPLVIVSRYEPLSSRDSLEAVPDLNRGRGKGK